MNLDLAGSISGYFVEGDGLTTKAKCANQSTSLRDQKHHEQLLVIAVFHATHLFSDFLALVQMLCQGA